MGWEQRGNHSYYYYKRRVGRQIVSDYVGRGTVARAIADVQANDAESMRLLKQREREKARSAREALEQPQQEIREIGELITGVVCAVLNLNGYHSHKGQWRYKRMAQSDQALATAAAVDFDEFKEMLRKYNGAKNVPADALALLDRGFECWPEMWTVLGDQVKITRNRMIEHHTPAKLTQASIKHGIKQMATELGAATSPLLECLLIDQVLTCWVNVTVVLAQYNSTTSQDYNLKHGEHIERRLSSAQARYLRAVEALARVRKLAQRNGPLQLNIGGQQVNVVAPMSAPGAPIDVVDAVGG